MRLSIIVPVLNETQVIESFLQQFEDARRAGHELIVVDGGSDDDTLERAKADCDLALVSERGRARQLQAGVDAASGDGFWLVHADTLLRPDLFRSVVRALERLPNGWGRFDVRLSGSHWMLRIVERMMNLRSRLTGIATGDQAIFVARDALERVGGVPMQPLLEDVELCKRLKRRARPICLRERIVTSSRRWERDGIWRTVALMWWLRLRYFLGAEPKRLHALYYGPAS